jgi:arylsulfatase A
MEQVRYHRRGFLKLAGAALAGALAPMHAIPVLGERRNQTKTNFIIIFCDDMGYADLGCFGSTKHRTPHIDRMAAEGTRFTSFYSTSSVCTPSRASLMTGCYPRRNNMHQNEAGLWVLFPRNKTGLHPDEITIAEVLKEQDYATACIGKWHLGDQIEFLPTRQGFDYYFGIPYSNDMGGKGGSDNRPPLPLMRNETVIEAPVDQDTLTKRYTEEAVRFIEANRDRPFLLYLPHTMPHVPLHASERFRGKSANGRYGDTIEEIDWSTGQILEKLKDLGIDDHTLVVFTSDNGAAVRGGGSNEPLRGGKGTTWEGGMRVPCVMRWPGTIPAGRTCDQLVCTMDLLPTLAFLAGTRPPADRIIDGKDIRPLLRGDPGAGTPHEAFYYYQEDQLQAVRDDRWKLYLPLKLKKHGWRQVQPDSPLQLYDLQADIGERNNVADRYPEVVERLTALAERARDDLGDIDRPGRNQRPAGFVPDPSPRIMTSEGLRIFSSRDPRHAG